VFFGSDVEKWSKFACSFMTRPAVTWGAKEQPLKMVVRLAALFRISFGSLWRPAFNESVKAFEEPLLSAAIRLMSRTLRGVCFRALVPLSSLVCVCGHARLFGVRACLKFGFKIVNTLFSFVVLNPLRSGKAAEDFVLSSLAL
jgi:hypothetical protein